MEYKHDELERDIFVRIKGIIVAGDQNVNKCRVYESNTIRGKKTVFRRNYFTNTSLYFVYRAERYYNGF